MKVISLRASFPIWASERFAASSRILARLALLAQIGELARKLENDVHTKRELGLYTILLAH